MGLLLLMEILFFLAGIVMLVMAIFGNTWLYLGFVLCVIIGCSIAGIGTICLKLFRDKCRTSNSANELKKMLIGEARYLKDAADKKKEYDKEIAEKSIQRGEYVKMVEKPKEKNSAFIGGMLEGLGGVALGVAGAYKAEAENAVERLRYKKEILTAAMAEEAIIADANKMRQLRSEYFKMLDEYAASFYADYSMSTSELEKYIKISDIKITFTGESARVRAKWLREGSHNIDGTFRAKLYNAKDEYVGCTYMDLPLYGERSSGELCGDCLVRHDPPVRAEIEAVYLWRCVEKKEEAKPITPPVDPFVEKRNEISRQEEEESLVRANKKAKKTISLAILVSVSLVLVTILAAFGINAIYKSSTEKNIEEAREEALVYLERKAEEFKAKRGYVQDIECSILDVKISKHSGRNEKQYLVTVRVDITATGDAYQYDSDLEYAFQVNFELDNGKYVTTSCNDIDDEYCLERMIYIYVNGSLEREPLPRK